MPDLGELIQDLISGDLLRAELAARALAQVDPAESLPALKELCHHPSSEARWWAARTLSAIPSPEAGHLLALALRDENGTVRQCAALALRERPHLAALPALIEMLDSSDGLTARLAADALIAADEDATEALIAVLAHGGGAAQVQAARALALIGDRRAIGPLFQALDGASSMVEHWASEGLDRMGVGMQFFSPGA